jgi:hypothetical protein
MGVGDAAAEGVGAASLAEDSNELAVTAKSSETLEVDPPKGVHSHPAAMVSKPNHPMPLS